MLNPVVAMQPFKYVEMVVKKHIDGIACDWMCFVVYQSYFLSSLSSLMWLHCMWYESFLVCRVLLLNGRIRKWSFKAWWSVCSWSIARNESSLQGGQTARSLFTLQVSMIIIILPTGGMHFVFCETFTHLCKWYVILKEPVIMFNTLRSSW